MNRVDHQVGFILKSQSFKETSLIHQVFTRDYGVLSIISKGSRAKNSKHGSLLQPFKSLSFSWLGKGELKTLTAVDESLNIGQLTGTSLYCGFYINELILNLLHKHDAHPNLFTAFKNIVIQLFNGENIEANLRQFEKVLLDEIGYGLLLEHEVESNRPLQPEQYYAYSIGHGPMIEENAQHPLNILGSTLLNLHNNTLRDTTELKQAKRLMRRLIDHQLDGKILKSRELFV